MSVRLAIGRISGWGGSLSGILTVDDSQVTCQKNADHGDRCLWHERSSSLQRFFPGFDCQIRLTESIEAEGPA